MARATNGSSRQMPRFPCRGRRFGAENREEMISAVPLRLASRLDLAGLLRRDWRVAAMIGLLLLVPGAGIVEGQIARGDRRSEEHTSELQSLMRLSYAVFCLKK